MNPSSSTIKQAAGAQLCGALLAFGLAYIAYRPLLLMPLAWCGLQGLCAAFVAWRLDAPRWWWLIHALFMPLVVLAMALQINSGWYLGAFLALLLVFWRTDTSRVPLYLSNATTAAAVLALLPQQACKVLDAGCGTASLLRQLARARPDCQFVGYEHAPATWLWARLASLRYPNVAIHYGSFWEHSFSPYALVYAFLSPQPMAQLWVKACADMAPDSLLVSNSFNIPEQLPVQTLQLTDRRQTQLLCYKPKKWAVFTHRGKTRFPLSFQGFASPCNCHNPVRQLPRGGRRHHGRHYLHHR